MRLSASDVSFAGVSIGATTTAAGTVIALDSSKRYPMFVRVTTTGTGAYVRFSATGVAATTTDTLVLPSDAMVIMVSGVQSVSARSVSGTSNVSIASLERGGWGGPSANITWDASTPWDSTTYWN